MVRLLRFGVTLRVGSAAILLLLISFSLASGQVTLLYQKNGTAAGDKLGYSAAGVGDVDGDGKSDFIVGAPFTHPGGRINAGSAYVYSGATGVLLFQIDGVSAGDVLGITVAGAGDVNGDGRSDFIIGIPGRQNYTGSAYVYSGATGALIYQKDGATAGQVFGLAVSGINDLDGDLRADFIVSAGYASPGGVSLAGSVFIYSGATGSLIYQKDGGAAGDIFGFSVSGAGDLDGDGRGDFIVGACSADPGGRPGAGSAYIYSGATGALLYQKNGASNSVELGWSVSGAGDVDGDGRDDFIIGAPSVDFGGIGSVFVYSGTTGALLAQKVAPVAGSDFGITVAGTGDVDGDGKGDYAIGTSRANVSGIGNAGSVLVYSGGSGALLHQINGSAAGDSLGFWVADAGDVNGDGKTDIIIGAPRTDPGGITDAGSVYVYSFSPTGVTRVEFAGLPSSFTLSQNFPNPFNANTQIVFDIPGVESKSVRLEVFDILGQRIATLIDEPLSGGRYHITWDGRDGEGKSVASGVYFYHLTAVEFQEAKRMTLLK